MDTARSETSLDDLETFSRSEDNVSERYSNVVEGDMSVTVRGIVVAKD